ncbi:hypothetical protein PMIN02_012768 [Paraphaeosphaeria minitans]
MWWTYNTAINSPCLGPDLRLLQVKNERRQVAHQNTNDSSAERTTHVQRPSQHSDSMDLDLGSVNDQTLITSFSAVQTSFPGSGSRSIYQMCGERQAEFRGARDSGSS